MQVEDKSLLARTIKIVLDPLAYLLKVKQHNLALTVLEVIPLKKVAMRVNLVPIQSMEKTQVLETQTPIHHVAFDVVNKNK